jgi:Leucine-rich repeat (LRR) protein
MAVCLPDTVTDEDLEGMTSLDDLHPVWRQLRGRQITGRGIKRLTRLTTLRGLTLNGTSVADDDLLQLQAFPELTTLNLDGSRITPRALEHLKQLPNLRSVSLRWTTLPAVAVQQFQAGRQDLKVLSEFTDPPDEE